MDAAERDDLAPDEVDLVGQWLDTGNRIEGDAVCDRIAWLTRERLDRVGEADEGRSALYRDPRDGRLWELSHPWGTLRGGGPPRLTVVAPDAARRKYGAG